MQQFFVYRKVEKKDRTTIYIVKSDGRLLGQNLRRGIVESCSFEILGQIKDD